MDIKDNEKFSLIQDKVKEIIHKHLEINNDLEMNDDFIIDTYGINSIDVLELLLLIEKEFSIEINDDDLSTELFMNLSNLTMYILNLVSEDYFKK